MKPGGTHSPEARARIAAANRARAACPEWRAKLSHGQMLRPPPEHVAEILRLYRTVGLSRIAKRMGYHRKVIRRVVDQAGVPIRARGRPAGCGQSPEARAKIAAALTLQPTPDEAAEIVKLYRAWGFGLTVQRAGYGEAIVRRVLKQAGETGRLRGRGEWMAEWACD
jgi:hypothetical protein